VTTVPESAAIVVLGPDGRTVARNRTAGRLLGRGDSRPCWEVMGSLAGTEGLPCAPGCAVALRKEGLESGRHTRFRWHREPCDLWCVPVGEMAVCILRPPRPPGARERLTPRELDVLTLVAEGETTAGIAARLDVSTATVRTHVENVRGKLGVATRAAMVAQAYRLGWLG
jgi:DNA-binding CsgD family transcriptional regulator